MPFRFAPEDAYQFGTLFVYLLVYYLLALIRTKSNLVPLWKQPIDSDRFQDSNNEVRELINNNAHPHLSFRLCIHPCMTDQLTYSFIAQVFFYYGADNIFVFVFLYICCIP